MNGPTKKTKYPTKQVRDFLMESNAIEGVYGPQSLKEAQMAWDYAFDHKEEINLQYILKVHELLLKRLAPAYAGKWRKCDVWIGGHRKIFVSVALIKEDVTKWLEMCSEDLSKLSMKEKLDKITEWHLQIEEVHPHCDGNGRVYRLIMNIQRFKNGLPVWVIHEGDEQMRYYSLFHGRH